MVATAVEIFAFISASKGPAGCRGPVGNNYKRTSIRSASHSRAISHGSAKNGPNGPSPWSGEQTPARGLCHSGRARRCTQLVQNVCQMAVNRVVAEEQPFRDHWIIQTLCH